MAFFQVLSHTIGFIHMIQKNWSHDGKHFLVHLGKVLQHSIYKLLKRSKFETNLSYPCDG